MTEITVKRALFVAEDTPDLEVRVLLEPDDTVSFTLNYGDRVHTAQQLPAGRYLQHAEGLQFVVDQIATKVPGWKSPAVRGWTKLMDRAYHIKDADILLDEPGTEAFPLKVATLLGADLGNLHTSLLKKEQQSAADNLAELVAHALYVAKHMGVDLPSEIEELLSHAP